MRMIKLFAWEPHVLSELARKREDELKQVMTGRLLYVALFSINMMLPLLAKISTFATYVSCLNIKICCRVTSHPYSRIKNFRR